jgi:parvulin-like peptidyl-prolyl isomerase
MRRLKAGEDFSKLAEIYSMDPSRGRGGDIGARPLGMLPESVEDTISALSPGEVTDPIHYDSYYVIIKLVDKTEKDVPELEAARPGIEAMIRTRAETALQRKLAAEIKEKYGLTFVPDALETVAMRTRELYTSDDVNPGLIPEFSDEELDRNLAHFQGGEWRIRNYTEKLKMQPPLMRPGRGTDSEVIASVIGDFITGDLWMVEIRNEGYTQRPEVLALANRVMEEAMITALHDELVRNVEVPEDTLRKFYEEQKPNLMSEGSYRLAAIALDTEEDAAEVHRLLEAGGNFEDLARARSVDEKSAENGGALRGLLFDRQLEMFPDVEVAIEGLEDGDYSDVTPMPAQFLPGNYVIFKLLERIEPRQLTYDEVREDLSEKALIYEQDRVFGKWLAQKMEEYDVEIYPAGLESIKFHKLAKEQD